MVSCRAPPQNTGPQAIACPIATPLPTQLIIIIIIFFIECYKEHTKPMPGVSAIRNSVWSYKIMKILFKWHNEIILRALELLDVRRVSR